MNPKLAEMMIALCAEAGPLRTIEPGEVARAFAEASGKKPASWGGYLQSVRDTAVALAREGRIIIYRDGAPVEPSSFRGGYRLGVPNFS